ncbi:10095_t:CDS:1, partial [Acaulospora colombiana]
GSPSPPTMSLLLQGMGMSGLMSASASVSGAASASGFQSGFASPLSSSRAPSPARSVSPPVHNTISEITPSITSGSPRSATKEPPNVGSSPLKRPSLPPPGLGSNPNMPSPNMRASNRLSFISYTDLLNSAPIASQSLSSVLSPGQNEPPTHLVVVDADNAPSVVGSGTNASSGHLPLGIGSLNVSNPSDKVDVDSLGTVGLSSAGEWGREGLGGGLEERLERLWAAEKEINERGRAMKPSGSASRSTSIGVSIDNSQTAPTTT